MEHASPQKPKNSPHRWVPKIYGHKCHLVLTENVSSTLSTEETRDIQRVVGSFLYHVKVIDNTILTSINDISTTQAAPNKIIRDATIMIMDYSHTHANKKIRYNASVVQICIDSDTAYLVAPKAKSRIVEYFYFSDQYKK